jgi:serine/threonine protein kinase
MSLILGDKLGRYEIIGPIGAGGMGEVFRARDPRLGRDVAIKVLPAAMAQDPDRLARFKREARAVAALNHPHIVTIYSVEQAGDIHFLTMELVEGKPLDRVICASSRIISADSGAARADEGFWVAVLPFKAQGSSPDLAALAEGLTEDIVTGMSRFSYLRVVARSATLSYANKAIDLRVAG